MQPTELEHQYQEALTRGDGEEAARIENLIDQEQQQREQRLNAPGALLNAALWYAAQGISVFPVRAGEKQPATKHGFHDATTDPDRITEWWTQNPNANIGLPTGHQFDVIDVDGPSGYESYALMRQRNRVPHIIGKTSTPRGMHIYIHPTGDANTTGILPGIDVRGIGGYVLAPPSRLANGETYRWAKPLNITRSAK